MAEPLIQYETRSGEPVKFAGGTLVPFSKVLIIRLPGLHGGFIWNRPASVAVKSDDGHEQVIPVVDVTRLAIWNMLGGCFIVMAIVWLITRLRQG